MSNDAMLNEAGALDQEVANATQPPPPAPDGQEQEFAAFLELALGLAEPAYPGLKNIYTPEARERLARAAGPLMRKYNISAGQLFARYKEEIDFGFVMLPIILQTVRCVQEQNARKPNPAAPPAPASPPATPGRPPAADVEAPLPEFSYTDMPAVPALAP